MSRLFDMFGMALEAPFKIAPFILFGLVGLGSVAAGSTLIFNGTAIWTGLGLLALGAAIIALPWALKKIHRRTL